MHRPFGIQLSTLCANVGNALFPQQLLHISSGAFLLLILFTSALLKPVAPCLAQNIPLKEGQSVRAVVTTNDEPVLTLEVQAASEDGEAPAGKAEAAKDGDEERTIEDPPQPEEGRKLGVQIRIPAVRLAPAQPIRAARIAIAQVAVSSEPENVWIQRGQKDWTYWDRPETPAGKWRLPDFDEKDWATGTAPLGYGDKDIQTQVSFGTEAEAKQLVTYLRYSFQLKEVPKVDQIAGSFICDDGAVIYLNGKEIHRYNLADGELSDDMLAKETISDDKERAVWDLLANPNLLQAGKNTIAVRLHQASKTSSDVAFDLELRGITEAQVKPIRERIEKHEPQPSPPAKDEAKQEADGAVEVENKAADANVARAAQVVAAVPEQPQRNFIHLSDGEATYYQPNGTTQTQRMDALEQVKMYVPQAKLARAMEGDTFAKLARQFDIPAETLSLLNRRPADKPFSDEEIFCIGWAYQVREGDTLATVAKAFSTKPEILAKLNAMTIDQALEKDKTLQVPGEFTYHSENKINRYLQIAMYPFASPTMNNQIPYNPQSVKMRREQVPEDQTMADYAKANNDNAKHLAVMNGLEEDAKLVKGQWMLLEYSVEIAEKATVAQLAQVFGMDEAKLRQANNLAEDERVEAGRRFDIPIGDRMNQQVAQNQQRTDEEWPVYEITLGDFRAASKAGP